MGIGKFAPPDARQIVLTMETPEIKKIDWGDVVGPDEFFELIRQMRHNQRRFARTQNPHINETRLKLESEVDLIIGKLTDSQLKMW